MKITISDMREEDLSRVMEIEGESFNTPWSQNSFRRELSEENYALYLTAYSQGMVIGYIGGWLILDELHITNLAVDSAYRRQGIASRLLAELVARARENGCEYAVLEVRISNQAAYNLYSTHGFKEVGYRKDYYQDTGENALIMRKEFQENGKKSKDRQQQRQQNQQKQQ